MKEINENYQTKDIYLLCTSQMPKYGVLASIFLYRYLKSLSAYALHWHWQEHILEVLQEAKKKDGRRRIDDDGLVFWEGHVFLGSLFPFSLVSQLQKASVLGVTQSTTPHFIIRKNISWLKVAMLKRKCNVDDNVQPLKLLWFLSISSVAALLLHLAALLLHHAAPLLQTSSSSEVSVKLLSRSQQLSMGDITRLDESKDVGARNLRQLAALYCGATSGFERCVLQQTCWRYPRRVGALAKHRLLPLCQRKLNLARNEEVFTDYSLRRPSRQGTPNITMPQFHPAVSTFRPRTTDLEGFEALVHVSSQWGVAQGLGSLIKSFGDNPQDIFSRITLRIVNEENASYKPHRRSGKNYTRRYPSRVMTISSPTTSRETHHWESNGTRNLLHCQGNSFNSEHIVLWEGKIPRVGSLLWATTTTGGVIDFIFPGHGLGIFTYGKQ
ncbi:hypothetical protein LguiA_030142 [Lonicera macranthoides]